MRSQIEQGTEKSAIRRQVREHTKGRVLAGREEVKEIAEKEQWTACGRVDEERMDRTFVTKKGEAGKEIGPTGAGGTSPWGPGVTKKSRRPLIHWFSVISRDLPSGQAPSENIVKF